MLLVKDQNGDYSASNLGRVLKLTTDRDDLLAEYIFGRNQTTTFINTAEGSANPQIYGAQPIYGDHRISVDGSHAINTGYIPAGGDDLTVMLFVAFPNNWPANTDAAGRHGLFGDQIDASQIAMTTSGTGAAGFGATLAMQTGATDGSTIVNGQDAIALANPAADFRALVGSIGGTVNPAITIAEYKGGARLWEKPQVFGGKTRQYVGLSSQLIGSIRQAYPDGLVSGRFDCAGALIWRRALNSADTLAAYLEARTVFASMGIDT